MLPPPPKIDHWQSKSAKLQALQALVAKQTWQGFSSNTARLCKTATPTNLPKHCPSKGAKLQTWQGCKIANLQGSNTAGPAPTLQDFPSKSDKLQALARLQNCQPARAPTLQGCKATALANLANLPKFQHCRLPTCCKVCQATNKAAKSKLQGSLPKLPHCEEGLKLGCWPSATFHNFQQGCQSPGQGCKKLQPANLPSFNTLARVLATCYKTSTTKLALPAHCPSKLPNWVPAQNCNPLGKS